jgi:membrane-bound lytic murein transglycosylase D
VRKSAVAVHRVRRGQTLAQIAHRYGSSIESIRRANGLRNANHIRAGQALRIPR